MTPAEIAKEARKKAKEWIRIQFPDLTIQEKSENYADIVATSLDGQEYFFEVKGTTKECDNFGAATLTECVWAINNSDCYFFLLINIKKEELHEAIKMRTLEEMFPHMSVPPFKINFNLRECKRKNKKEKADGSAVVDKKLILEMDKFYKERIKRNNKEK